MAGLPSITVPEQEVCLGLESDPFAYVGHLVAVFREVWRVLRSDGVAFVVLGDSYTGYHGNSKCIDDEAPSNKPGYIENMRESTVGVLKQKNLVGIPWRVAFALQADGWYLRSSIIWAKGLSYCDTYSGSVMPESCTDRPTRAHENIFLLAKSKRYFFDQEAIKEDSVYPDDDRKSRSDKSQKRMPTDDVAGIRPGSATYSKRNPRDVWAINPQSYRGSHYAVFPEALVTPMILAGSSECGACVTCGAGWVRVVEKTGEKYCPPDAFGRPRMYRCVGQVQDKGGGKGSQGFFTNVKATTGWHPTCSHYPRTSEWPEYPRKSNDETDDQYNTRIVPIQALRSELLTLWESSETQPCVVLDPFAGSGTTGLVSIRHNRSFIGLDLSHTYLSTLAKERTNEVQRTLFNLT